MKAVPTIVINQVADRARAILWADKAPWGTVIQYRKPKRSLPQNARLHALITEIATQVEWAGKKRDVEAWKDIFTAALLSATHDLDVVPGINGGFVLLGLHTSELNVEQCGDLMTLIEAFGAERGVVFSEPAALTSASGSPAVDRGESSREASPSSPKRARQAAGAGVG